MQVTFSDQVFTKSAILRLRLIRPMDNAADSVSDLPLLLYVGTDGFHNTSIVTNALPVCGIQSYGVYTYEDVAGPYQWLCCIGNYFGIAFG